MKKTMFTMTAVALGLSVAQGAQAACTDITQTELLAAVQQAASTSGALDPAVAGVYACVAAKNCRLPDATGAKVIPNTDVTGTGGYNLPMWVTMVDESGAVCYVVTSGNDAGSGVSKPATGVTSGNTEWLGSRVISAQKAFTANAFSLDGYAISTANLYSPTQEGGSLYGLQFSNPVDASKAYGTAATGYGAGSSDPMKGLRIGGVNVFGGGLALYNPTTHKKIGAIGVSGDTSCRDHAFAWKVRANLRHGTGATAIGGLPNGYHPAAGTGNCLGNQAGITNCNMDSGGGGQSLPNGLASTRGDELITTSIAPANYGNIGSVTTQNSYWFTAWSHPACPNTVMGTSVGVIDLTN